MIQFAAAQQISTAKFSKFYQRFQIKERALAINEVKMTDENVFNGCHFRTNGNHEYSTNEKILVQVFLQICDPCDNPQTAKFIYLLFSSILCFLQFLGHLLLYLEAKSKIVPFYLKFSGKRAYIFGVLMYYCWHATNMHTDFTSISSMILNKRACSKG